MKMASPRAASVLLERGNIYFAYRLRVEAQTAHGFDDVQRLYVVLSPRGKASYRLIVIGQKKLPVVAGGGDRMAWGFVEEVSSRPEDVEDELDPRRYFTKTRGEDGNYIVNVKNPKTPSPPGTGLDKGPRVPPARACMPSHGTTGTPTSGTCWSCRRSRARFSTR